MNTRNIFIIAAALLLIAASCQSVLEEQVQEEPKVTDEIVEDDGDTKIQAPDITAAQEGDNPSKSVLEVDGDGVGTIYWTPADEINVFYGTTSTHYVSQNTVNATTAVFSTTDIIGSTESASESIWGLYPYNPSATCSGSAVTTTLPATQYGVPGTFDDDLFITLAHNNSTALKFYNVCGGIKFSLSRDDITSITFRGNNKEDIAGDISLDFVDGLPNVSVTSGVKEITLTPKAGGTFASGENYYIILLPSSLTGGFTMIFSTSTDEVGTFSYTDKAVTIKRSSFGKKALIDTYASFEPVSHIHRNQITYTSTDHNVVTPYNPDAFGANIISNTYSDGVDGYGTIEFDDDISAIGANAFKNCSTLKTIEIPQGISSIGDYAFYCCHYLTTAEIPDGVTSIGARAFMQCNRLPSINIPYGVTSIGEWAFYSATNQAPTPFDLIIPDSVTSIGAKAFYYLTGLGSVVLPNGITSIESELFCGCRKLTTVVIPEGISSIGDSAFYLCEALTSITLPSSLTYIGEAVFGLDSNLTSCSILATTPPQVPLPPPQLPEHVVEVFFYCNDFTIYVPAESVDAYKAAYGWSIYSSKIQAIQN